ncbi:hypothetical protein [Burkholderia gladioli]|uniref:hypothetical protein n=1 Tax=Burkholderia gladioli TaxID=28095 RepID=UPI003D1EA51E
MPITHISMTPQTRLALKTAALLRGVTMARIVADAVDEYVNRNGLLATGKWRIRPDAENTWMRATAVQAAEARKLGWEVELITE